MNKILLSCVPLIFIACMSPNISSYKTAENETKTNPSTDPDPQANNIQYCVENHQYYADRNACYAEKRIYLAILTEPKNRSAMAGPARGEHNVTLDLRGKDIIVLYINTYGIVGSISTRKELPSQVTAKGTLTSIIIQVKDVKDKIEIIDSKGKVLLEYGIIR